MSTPSPAPFRLSSTLAGHESDVRSLTSSSKASSGTLCPTIYSSSRDGTARSWVRTIGIKGGEDWREEYVFGGEWHTGFVNAVQWIPGSNEEGSTGGSLITAGQDSLIHVWPLPSSSTTTPLLKPSNTLVGHTGNVCALGASKDGKRLVSGSWDKTGKVWNTSDFSLAYTLEGHEQAVWAVLALESDDELVLTGAADNLVKLWRKDKVINTFKGHTQAVRALAKLDSGVAGGDLFASAGNDGTIRLWSLSKGDAVHVLYGHDSFVYSLAAIPDSAGGGLVSGGEDRTMRVWRAADGECEQSITIPAVSVWTVACLSNGDIVAGSSDGLVRVFSRDESRVADLEALTAYDQQVSKTSVNSSQVGAINKNDLLGPEALDQPGKKEGQVLVIKNAAGGAEAYQWSRTTGWTSVGEVVDAVGSDRKQLYMGQEYDYVFDVDFKDGAQPLKLPYNASQNPYEAAQKFLLANELPLEYMDQVIDFIDKSTAGVTLGAASNEYVDPYTGASRYTGGGAGSTPAAPSGGFTGDPYTGGGRSVQAPVETKLLPHKTFLNFPQVNLPALRKKIGELNDTLAAGSASSAIALTPEELTALDKLLIAAGTSSVKAVGDSESAVAIKLLHWPSAQIFPPLDLIRVISRFAPLSESIPLLLQAIQNTAGPAKEQETNTMLAYRAFANTFGTKKGQELLVDEVDEIIETLSRRGFISVSKNGKVALATIVLNYSILAVQDKLESPSAAALFDFVGDLLRDSDGEVVYRSLVALGNLSLATKFSSSMPAAGLARYKTLAKDAVKRLPESRNKAIMVEIERGAR